MADEQKDLIPPDTSLEARVAPAVKGTTKKNSLLDQIRKESLARVNKDTFDYSEQTSRFDVPLHLIPEGFTVEWKNTHVMGQPVDAAYNLRLEQAGWRVAPVDLFKELVPPGWDKPGVEREGQILMIRPMEVTQLYRDAEVRRARGQVGDKMKQLGQTEKGEMDRKVVVVKRDFERVQVQD